MADTGKFGMPTPRKVLVTGASSGIGRATVMLLAGLGDDIVLVARRKGALEELASLVREHGASATVHALDVTDRDGVADLFAASGPFDAVVHAAGVAAYGRFTDVPGTAFDRVLEINLLGSVNVAREAVTGFEARGGGHLVLVGSVVGRVGVPFMSPYVVSKWAVRGLARTLQAEVSGTTKVTLVEPGGVDTSIYDKAATYLGVQGKPPPPVADAEAVAHAIVKVLDHPVRRRSIGALNPLLTVGSMLAPAVYDRIAPSLMTRLALDDTATSSHTGNLFEALPEPERTDPTMPIDDSTAVVERLIDAPPEAVWSVLADGWLYPCWVVGASRMRDVEESWPAEGSRLHHSVGNWPLLINDKTEVLESEPERRLALKAHGWPAGAAEVVIELEPRGSGTIARIQEDATEGVAMLMPKRLRQLAIVPRNKEALRRLGFLAEGR